jgi:hypothetical protein
MYKFLPCYSGFYYCPQTREKQLMALVSSQCGPLQLKAGVEPTAGRPLADSLIKF